MKRLLLLALMLIPMTVGATTLTFDVPPGATLTPALLVTVFSSDFNGTPLAGQAVSLDAVFAGNVLARISGDFYFMGLIFSTTSPVGPGLPGDGTGYALGAFGLPVEPAVSLDRSMSGRGSFSVGMSLPTSQGRDFRGGHFDFSMPTCAGCTVTNTTLRFSVDPPNGSVTLGTAAQLPEPQPLLLLSLSLPLIYLFHRSHQPQRWKISSISIRSAGRSSNISREALGNARSAGGVFTRRRWWKSNE